jgi:phytoene dehydrogenase-like protein
LAAYASHVALGQVRDLENASDITTRAALEAAGLGGPMLERVLRPFLAGVFLEPDLDTSRRFGDLALRSFVRGTPAVPRAGMGAIPQQLAARLADDTVRTGVTAERITSAGVETNQGTITAASVVVAADPVTACALLELPTPQMNAGTTWYHRTDVSGQALGSGVGAIVVDGENKGPLTSAVVLTNVFKGFTDADSALVSSAAIGYHTEADTERAARAHLATLYGVDTSRWQLVASYPIRHALPSMRPPFDVRKSVRLSVGRYVAGDHRDTSSIQGALVSGRRAAKAVLNDRKVRNVSQ